MGRENPLKQAMGRNLDQAPLCPYMGPKNNINNWEKMGADKVLLTAIRQGVKAPMHCAPKPEKTRNPPTETDLMETIGEYLKTATLRMLTREETQRTKVWTPIFPREKKGSTKVRVITDLRNLNACHQVPKHKQETWGTVLETLQDKTLTWGLTLDLKMFSIIYKCTNICRGG